MKKQFIIGLLVVLLVAASCSSGGGGSDSDTTNSVSKESASIDGIASDSYGSEQESSLEQEPDSEQKSDSEQENQIGQTATATIDRQMLVYSCDVKIDTLDYEKSIGAFKAGLQEIGGFVESEYYSDGVEDYGYYVEESKKTKNYTATVRIPSIKYDSFVGSLGELGDVRSQKATVENVSQEYKDAGIQLEILKAKEASYLKMLKKAKTTNEIVTIQDTLTELQVQIEQLKSRMQKIETDVAYSFINIEISEVTKYRDKPKKTATFFQRLSNTVADTTSGFLEFLEGLLFVIIRLFPYVVFLAIVLPIIFRIKKWYKKRHSKVPQSSSMAQMQAFKQGQDEEGTYAAPNYEQGQTSDENGSNNI